MPVAALAFVHKVYAPKINELGVQALNGFKYFQIF